MAAGGERRKPAKAPAVRKKRRSVCNDEAVRSKFLGLLREGLPIETALPAAGLSSSSVYYLKSQGDPFWGEIERARAEGQLALYRRARRGDSQGLGFGPARASLELLQRVNPRTFAQRINVKVEEELDDLINIAAGVLPTEHFEALLRAITAHRQGDDGLGQGSDTGEAGPEDPAAPRG
jgi:hypothetical protein